MFKTFAELHVEIDRGAYDNKQPHLIKDIQNLIQSMYNVDESEAAYITNKATFKQLKTATNFANYCEALADVIHQFKSI